MCFPSVIIGLQLFRESLAKSVFVILSGKETLVFWLQELVISCIITADNPHSWNESHKTRYHMHENNPDTDSHVHRQSRLSEDIHLSCDCYKIPALLQLDVATRGQCGVKQLWGMVASLEAPAHQPPCVVKQTRSSTPSL